MHGDVEALCRTCGKNFMVHVMNGAKHLSVSTQGCDCEPRKFVLYDVIPFLRDQEQRHVSGVITVHFGGTPPKDCCKPN